MADEDARRHRELLACVRGGARCACLAGALHHGPLAYRTSLRSVLLVGARDLARSARVHVLHDHGSEDRASGRRARIVYATAIALVFVALAAPQRTEFAPKVALLAALALVCAARPLLERLVPPASRRVISRRPLRRVAGGAVVAAVYAVIVIGAGALAGTPVISSAAAFVPTSCTQSGARSDGATATDHRSVTAADHRGAEHDQCRHNDQLGTCETDRA